MGRLPAASFLAAFLVAILPALASAEPGPLPASRPEGSPEAVQLPQEPVPEIRADPFRVSYTMQQKALHGDGGPGFKAGQDVPVPDLTLKGVVGDKALLEVQGGDVYLVREGDAISLQRQGGNTVLNIKKIERQSLSIETGTAKLIVVR